MQESLYLKVVYVRVTKQRVIDSNSAVTHMRFQVLVHLPVANHSEGLLLRLFQIVQLLQRSVSDGIHALVFDGQRFLINCVEDSLLLGSGHRGLFMDRCDTQKLGVDGFFVTHREVVPVF